MADTTINTVGIDVLNRTQTGKTLMMFLDENGTPADQTDDLTRAVTLTRPLPVSLTNTAAVDANVDTFTFAAGASLSSSVNMAGRSVVRMRLGATWTAANVTVSVSSDNVTFFDLYDDTGLVYTVIMGANRSVYIAPGPLLRLPYLRLRSGTPTTPVNQVAATSILVSSAPL
jgi:hypothetical protein